MSEKNSISKNLVWVIIGLLILGLAGFGTTNFSGTVRSIGTAGDQDIPIDAYARELRRELRAAGERAGQPVTMEQGRAAGLDRAALSRLVALASLDHETAEIGLSVGDANLQKEILSIPAFQDISGKFDRETYRFQLEQAGMSESQFEQDLRAESARTLVQTAITSGVTMPEVLTRTILDFVGERRSFAWATLGPEDLESTLPTPSEDELRAYYDENPDLFMLPETRKLSYVLLTPDMILDQVETDQAAARALYDERADQYQIPERRLVERLVFPDQTAADNAMAQLEVGGTSFEQLVQGRGLTLADVDMGDVTASDLGAAAEVVFAAEIGTIAGPLPSSLGPALFRINGTLAAHSTSFEDALPELTQELAGDRARRLIEAQAEEFDDLLAGGATLEELADETDLTFGQIDWNAESSEGIAAYDAFRAAAARITPEDFPEVTYLDDGGVFAMRLDDTLPRRPEPYADATARVTEAWTLQATRTALQAQADAVVAQMADGTGFEAAGLTPQEETNLTRTAFVEGTSPDFMNQVFEMESGDLRVLPWEDKVLILRLSSIAGPGNSPELSALAEAVQTSQDQALSQALFQAYMRDAQQRAQPQINQQAVNAVLSSFQ